MSCVDASYSCDSSVPLMLNSEDSSICDNCKISTKHSKDRIRFVISVSENIKEALALDACNKNDLWRKVFVKELDKIRVAFLLLDDEEHAPVGSKKINY